MKKLNVFLVVCFALLLIGFVGGMETSESVGLPLVGALLSLAALILSIFSDRKRDLDDEDEDGDL